MKHNDMPLRDQSEIMQEFLTRHAFPSIGSPERASETWWKISLLLLQVAAAITAMEGRLKAVKKSGERPLTYKEELALRLNKQYPRDVGVLSAFFLNLVKLQAGQVNQLFSLTVTRYEHAELLP